MGVGYCATIALGSVSLLRTCSAAFEYHWNAAAKSGATPFPCRSRMCVSRVSARVCLSARAGVCVCVCVQGGGVQGRGTYLVVAQAEVELRHCVALVCGFRVPLERRARVLWPTERRVLYCTVC